MKKFFICLTLCLISVFMLFGCGKGETRKTVMKSDYTETVFTMTMEKKNSFYYPTVKGELYLSIAPTKLTVNVQYKGSFEIPESELKIINLGDSYLVSFEKEHIYGSLEEGEYLVTLKAHKGEKFYILDYKTFFSVDDLYTGMAIFDWETGESFYAMDKESNWTRPY